VKLDIYASFEICEFFPLDERDSAPSESESVFFHKGRHSLLEELQNAGAELIGSGKIVNPTLVAEHCPKHESDSPKEEIVDDVFYCTFGGSKKWMVKVYSKKSMSSKIIFCN